MRLTERQEKALLRLLRQERRDPSDGSDAIDPALARQMAARDLVMMHHMHERREWNRVVARLRVVTLTPLGRAEAERLERINSDTEAR